MSWRLACAYAVSEGVPQRSLWVALVVGTIVGAISGVSVPLPSAAPPKPSRGGLAPWQIRRVTTHIEMNLDGAITTKDLATLARLSSYHFCRAFRHSFGDSPHGFVMRRRVERAQGLMLTTNASLGQIAADCGLTDQAHFNKLFRRFVGESPGVWRRARVDQDQGPRTQFFR